MSATGRDRILAALDGRVADRAPLALSFFDTDAAALAPPGAWRDDLVDVEFAAFLEAGRELGAVDPA